MQFTVMKSYLKFAINSWLIFFHNNDCGYVMIIYNKKNKIIIKSKFIILNGILWYIKKYDIMYIIIIIKI